MNRIPAGMRSLSDNASFFGLEKWGGPEPALSSGEIRPVRPA